ncbi:uncharacterized protein [Littorina saxatilis]|uniref:Claudin n=1 Tax=Littorina saxatilis TaxID=31220 RepID=A0AAN9AKE7_9CAEN
MGVLSQRHTGYKAGLGVLVLGSVVFIVGFATPHWAHYKLTLVGNTTIEGNSGLWKYCGVLLGDNTCTPYSFVTDVWLMATKALECIAMVGLVLAACYAVGVNFLVAQPRFSRFLELCTACAGTSGVLGAVIYVSRVNRDKSAVHKLYKDTNIDLYTVHWSFGFAIAGAVLILIATFLIGRNNKPLPHNQAAAGTSVASTTVAAPGNTSHYSVAHAPNPESNPYSVSVVVNQSGEPQPAPPSFILTVRKYTKCVNGFTKCMNAISDADHEEE